MAVIPVFDCVLVRTCTSISVFARSIGIGYMYLCVTPDRNSSVERQARRIVRKLRAKGNNRLERLIAVLISLLRTPPYSLRSLFFFFLCAVQ